MTDTSTRPLPDRLIDVPAPPPIDVVVSPLRLEWSGAVWLGEVRLAGRPVWGERYYATPFLDDDTARRAAHQQAITGFAERLASVLGYNPDLARR